MQAEKLRPRATGLIVGIWLAQALIAGVWIGTSRIEGASLWIWPFGFGWALISVVMAYRAGRQWVEVDTDGIRVQSGFRPSWSWSWQHIGDVTAEPAGPLVTHLAVVGRDGRVVETPLAKPDTRLREAWLAAAPDGNASAAGGMNSQA